MACYPNGLTTGEKLESWGYNLIEESCTVYTAEVAWNVWNKCFWNVDIAKGCGKNL